MDSDEIEIMIPFELKHQVNLRVLQRVYPSITNILCSANCVTVYLFNIEDNTWTKMECEGTLFVVRHDNEHHQIILLNKQSPANHLVDLLPTVQLEVTDTFLMLSTEGDIFGYWFYDAQEQAIATQVIQDKIAYGNYLPQQHHHQLQHHHHQQHQHAPAQHAFPLISAHSHAQPMPVNQAMPQALSALFAAAAASGGGGAVPLAASAPSSPEKETLRQTLLHLIQHDDTFFDSIYAAFAARSHHQ